VRTITYILGAVLHVAALPQFSAGSRPLIVYSAKPADGATATGFR
jgi:hypothetical protein